MKYFNKKKIKSLKQSKIFSIKKLLNILIIFFIFFVGIWTERFDFKLKIKSFSKDLIDTSANRLYSAFSESSEKLIINVNYKNYMKILSSRSESIKKFRASEDIHRWVPANLTIDNKNFKSEIKLKGVHSEHWVHPSKWSFKIKLLDEKSFNGMRRFSIQQPKTRDFLYEWLFMKVLSEETLISHRTKFIETIINGNNLGVYFLEEQHSKQLIENNKRREGPIIGLDKNLWINEANNIENLSLNVIEDSFWRAKIKPVQFQDDQIGTVQETYLKNAIRLFEDFRQNKINIDKAFDINQMAKLMAIKAIFGSSEFDWRDIKFYYNPITSLLEPIGREVHLNKNFSLKDSWWINNQSIFFEKSDQKDFVKLLYEDSKFYELYLTELQRLTEKNYLEDIITKNKEEFLNNKRLLEKNFPTSDVFSLEHFHKVRKIIRNTINPIQGINAYFSDLKNDHVQLSIQNLQRLPVVLKGVKLNNGEEIFLNNEIIVKGKKHNKPLENFQLKIPCNISQAKKKIKPIQCDKFLDTSQKFFSANNKLIFNILGQETYQEEIINRFYKNEEVYSKKKEIFDISKLSNISFLNIDLKRKEINFNSNQITVRDKLVFPSGYFVNFHPGTEIILSDEGQLISYSPIKMIGTQSIQLSLNQTLMVS